MKRKPLFLLLLLIPAVLAAVLLFPRLTGDTVFRQPEILIGHAVGDENGQLHGGKAGDQTGSEIRTETRKSNSFTAVLRAGEPEQAERIAATMEAACANDCIGYDQYNRTSLYRKAKKAHWAIDTVSKPCETDCSALVAVCVNAAGIKVSKDVYTGNLLEQLMATGKFELLDDAEYIGNIANLRRGDILLKKGHTAVVLKETEEKEKSGD